jgi:peptidylprolyl isomerase
MSGNSSIQYLRSWSLLTAFAAVTLIAACSPGPDASGPAPDAGAELEINDLEPGNGDVVSAGQSIEVHYTGWLWDDGVRGEQFDSSLDRGEPFQFDLGRCQVIRGWDWGVEGMRVGGRRDLIIPSRLAYGERGAGDVIPPNATLNFEIELLRIVDDASLPEGVEMEVIDHEVGTGDEAQACQTVEVHYTGWLWVDGARGAKFDSSLDRGEPFQFGLGMGQVIRGWDEGVQGMKVGGRRELIIPPEMGYGERGAGTVIPPGATLNFEVELLRVTS